MATTEKTGVLTVADGNGNKTILYPVTKASAIEGLDELAIGDALTLGGVAAEDYATKDFVEESMENVSPKPATVVEMVLFASGWVDGLYTIDIPGVTANSTQDFVPATTINIAQLNALQAANIIDHSQSENTVTLKAMGTIPTIDIPIRVVVGVTAAPATYSGGGEVVTEYKDNVFVGTREELEALPEDERKAIEVFVSTDEDYTDEEAYVTYKELQTTQVGDSAKLGGKSADSFYNLCVPTKTIPSGADLDNYVTEGIFLKEHGIEDVLNIPSEVRYHGFKLIVERANANSSIRVYQTMKVSGIPTEPNGYITYKRSNLGGTWQAWQRVAYTDNISNPNLLINGDFRVNQRGQSSYSGIGYTVDMWTLTNDCGMVAVNAKGITFSATGGTAWLVQYIENADYHLGENAGISVKTRDGKVYSASRTFPSTLPSSGETSIGNVAGDGFKVSVSIRSTGVLKYVLEVYDGSSIDIEYAKLEIGNVATPYSPRPYAEELALCQRYLVGNLTLLGYTPTSKTTVRFHLPLPLRRNTTSYTFINNGWELEINGTNKTANVTGVTIQYLLGVPLIVLSYTASNYNDVFVLHLNNSLVSAEL